MKVQIQTSVTPVVNLYDSTAKDTDSEFTKKLKKFLNPIVKVTDDSGVEIFKTGEFYTPWLMYIGLGIVGLLAINYISGIDFSKHTERRRNRKRLKKLSRRR